MRKANETNVSSVKTKTGSNNNACIITGSGEITFFLNGYGDVVTENNGVYIVKFSHDDTGKITDSITVTDKITLKSPNQETFIHFYSFNKSIILISLLIFSNRPYRSPVVFGRLGFVKKRDNNS